MDIQLDGARTKRSFAIKTRMFNNFHEQAALLASKRQRSVKKRMVSKSNDELFFDDLSSMASQKTFPSKIPLPHRKELPVSSN
jgi:hypothetical protein